MKDREYWHWAIDYGYDAGGHVSDTLWSSHDLAFKAAMKELGVKSIDFKPEPHVSDDVYLYTKGSTFSGAFLTIQKMKVGK
jgi:hypothetical protein